MRALAALDLRLLRLLRTRGHTPGLERAMIRLAQAGENGLLWNAIAVAGGVVSARRRDDYVRAVEIVLATLVLNTAVKYAVRRARPVLEEELPALTPVLSGRSYPSAHASTSFAGARALAAAGPAERPAPRRGGGNGAVAPVSRRALPVRRGGGRPAGRRGSAPHVAPAAVRVTREITRAIRSVKSMPAACAA